MFHNLRNGDGALQTHSFSFVEMASNNQPELIDFLEKFGFIEVGKHPDRAIMHYQQGMAHIIVNFDSDSHAMHMARQKNCHVIAGIGMQVIDSSKSAKNLLLARGAIAANDTLMSISAVEGPGTQNIYLVDKEMENNLFNNYFDKTGMFDNENAPVDLKVLDHITINVSQGELDKWHSFFIEVFGFNLWTDYEIKIDKTWYRFSAIMSQNGKIRLPMNEPLDNLSTVAEFVQNNSGSGSQHLAFQTIDIVPTVAALRERGIEFLTIPDTYYEGVDERMPGHGEDLERLKEHNILIDGVKNEHDRYLLLEQIFTKMMIKPIFFEVIKRRGNRGFGEGNVNALSKSLELDQIRRGVFKE